MDDLPGIGSVDYVLKSVDNDKQHDEDEIIKMDEIEALNDPACQHVPELDGDRMGGTISITCKNCPYGWYIPESEARSLGLLKD